MNTRMTVIHRGAQSVGYIVTGAPVLSAGVHEIRPLSLRVEGGTVAITGREIGPTGEPIGPAVRREYTTEQATDLPDWTEPIRSLFVEYAAALDERQDAVSDYDQAYGGTGLAASDLEPFEGAYHRSSRRVKAAAEALYA